MAGAREAGVSGWPQAVHLDEARIHLAADLGYGWAERGRRFWVASSGPPGRGPHPPGRGSRLWLGRARPALLGCLKLAGPIGAGLVLRAVSLQRGPGAAVALSAGQWRPHDRGAAAAPRRGS